MKVTLKKSKNNKLVKTPKDINKEFKQNLVKYFATFIFTFIYGIGMSWFLLASSVRLYSGGVPGLAQLVVDIVVAFGVKLTSQVQNIAIGILVLIGNIPILFLGWFGVSKKFTIFSLFSVLIQTTVLSLLNQKIFTENTNPTILAIMGGVLVGVGTGGALKYGCSTGGFDIIGQYYAHKTGKSVAFITTGINISITVVGAIIMGVKDNAVALAAEVFAYTSLRLLVSMVVTDRIHTSYHFIEVNIISNYPIELCEAIIFRLGRGVTIFDVRGGYGYNEKQMIYLVIFSHEKSELMQTIKDVDERAFIVFKTIDSVSGNFKRKVV